jgi:probable HAF family extracellular repeat protein
MGRLYWVLCCLTVVFVPVWGAGAATFIPLGGLVEGGQSKSYGISGDGSMVVGVAERPPITQFEAFCWEEEAMEGLGDFRGGDIASEARAVSADGRVVVGKSSSFLGTMAFAWEDGVLVGLRDLPGGDFGSLAKGISNDGTTIVGMSRGSLGSEAVIWVGDRITGLGGLPGNFAGSQAYAASFDGSVVVGQAVIEIGGGTELSQAFRHEGGVMSPLGFLEGGGDYSVAAAITPDGSVIVGASDSSSGDLEAFRWQDGAMLALGDLPGGQVLSGAFDVSADGSIVVGVSWSAIDDEAFIWDAEHGMRNLQQVLVEDFDLPVEDWQVLRVATGISDDGDTITGAGRNAQGDYQAWVVQGVPEPSTQLLQAAAMVALATVARSWRRSPRSLGRRRQRVAQLQRLLAPDVDAEP